MMCECLTFTLMACPFPQPNLEITSRAKEKLHSILIVPSVAL